ncbi:MAG: tetratricopeptide repeat protein [Gemmatimonadetes bacterium]|nr:tetratricopeptide repeat protein [Gemmatimonadota bacterium]
MSDPGSELPPPASRHGGPRSPFPGFGEPFEGASILDELPLRLACLLWEAHREVSAWTTTGPEERAGMFAPGAVERWAVSMARLARRDEPLRPALDVLRELLADPAGTDPRRVAAACERISAWAGEHGAPCTRFWFLSDASRCLPGDVRLLYRVGCLARDAARWEVAELHFQQGVVVARRVRDREGQAMSLLGLGNMHYRQGDTRAARATLTTGLRVARRYRLGEYEGRALHDLFGVAAHGGDCTRAEDHAREALRAYGSGHPLIPRLAHDVAYFWNNQGHYARALRVLQALLPHFERDPEQRTLALGSLARAAGGYGDAALFSRTWSELWKLVEEPAARAVVTASLIGAARGAICLRDWECARRTADTVLRIAQERREADVALAAEEILNLVEARWECIPELDRPGYMASSGRDSTLVVDLLRVLEEGAAAR